jgi:hypothetical protein
LSYGMPKLSIIVILVVVCLFRISDSQIQKGMFKYCTVQYKEEATLSAVYGTVPISSSQKWRSGKWHIENVHNLLGYRDKMKSTQSVLEEQWSSTRRVLEEQLKSK